MSTVQETIADIRALASQFGKLAAQNTITYPQAMAIIEHYEDGGEDSEKLELREAVEEANKAKAKAQGASGGLKKRINKLEAELAEAQAEVANVTRLTRVVDAAAALVACLGDGSEFLDENGQTLGDEPGYTRLVQELK